MSSKFKLLSNQFSVFELKEAQVESPVYRVIFFVIFKNFCKIFARILLTGNFNLQGTCTFSSSPKLTGFHVIQLHKYSTRLLFKSEK